MDALPPPVEIDPTHAAESLGLTTFELDEQLRSYMKERLSVLGFAITGMNATLEDFDNDIAAIRRTLVSALALQEVWTRESPGDEAALNEDEA
jgi:adenylosuccinate lyase